jgi:hypothetical protein
MLMHIALLNPCHPLMQFLINHKGVSSIHKPSYETHVLCLLLVNPLMRIYKLLTCPLDDLNLCLTHLPLHIQWLIPKLWDILQWFFNVYQ